MSKTRKPYLPLLIEKGGVEITIGEGCRDSDGGWCVVLRVLWRRGNGNRSWGRLKRNGNESWCGPWLMIDMGVG